MRSFSTVELLRDLKTVTHAASRAPVAITQHRKLRFVMMAIEDFEALQGGNRNSSRVYRTGETPSQLKNMLLKGLDRIANGPEVPENE